MKQDDFFIGWSADTPKADRRAFLAGGIVLSLGGIGGGTLLASGQKAVGPGTWNQGDVREFTGIASADPYAMLRTRDIGNRTSTALLGCLGKCGVAARIASYAGQQVTVRGSLIERGPHAMIAVIDGPDWIEPIEGPIPTDLAFPEPEPLGSVTLAGEILDTKCWFGAMRPSEGKVHKACASLCIRGGLPPAFFVKDRSGQSALMIMTDGGSAYGDDLLPLVAEPVEINAQVARHGDILMLDAPVSNMRIISA
ncbi:MAG: hypothetical protein AAF292_08360 [Pseudomonadota bacterium]